MYKYAHSKILHKHTTYTYKLARNLQTQTYSNKLHIFHNNAINGIIITNLDGHYCLDITNLEMAESIASEHNEAAGIDITCPFKIHILLIMCGHVEVIQTHSTVLLNVRYCPSSK